MKHISLRQVLRFSSLAQVLLLTVLSALPNPSHAQVLGDPVDVSQDFQKMENIYFVGSKVTSFDRSTGQGTLQWDRYWRNTTLSFNKIDVGFVRGRGFNVYCHPERLDLEN